MVGKLFFVLAITFGSYLTVFANEIDINGTLVFEIREFPEDAAYDGQFNEVGSSIVLEPEIFWQSDSRYKQVKFVPFIRIDSNDEERSHFDVREAYWRSIMGDGELLIGVNKVFWGVAESRHLVNIINQIDLVENIDGENYLGQAMIQYSRQFNSGRYDLFIMTGFRQRTFPGHNGRLRTPLPVDTDKVTYENGAKEWRPELALRYSHYIGDWDFGLHVFHGAGREPELIVSKDGKSLLPFYQLITQVGIDFQYTQNAWLLKLESIIRQGQSDTFSAVVAGVEYTIFQIFDTDADLGLIVEGLYDGRGQDVFPTIFDNDVFIGSRLALNDAQNSSLLIGLVTDLNDGLETFRVETERRIGDNNVVSLELQAFFQSSSNNPTTAFKNDSFITLRFSRYF